MLLYRMTFYGKGGWIFLVIGAVSASAAAVETSACVPSPLVPEDLKHLTAFPHKSVRSFQPFSCLNLCKITERRKVHAFIYVFFTYAYICICIHSRKPNISFSCLLHSQVFEDIYLHWLS